jgi:hypothetical protein
MTENLPEEVSDVKPALFLATADTLCVLFWRNLERGTAYSGTHSF